MYKRNSIQLFLLVYAVLFGCGGGEGAKNYPPDGEVEHYGDTGIVQPSVIVETVSEPKGDNCLTGGVALVNGTDTNRNNTLEENEISNTVYVCNGSNGVDGADGNNGTQAVADLVETVSLESGDSRCPYGGVEILTGADDNNNSELDVEEVEETRFICNGIDAVTTLISTETLSLGDENCSAGGLAVHSGIDTDGDGSLDTSEIDDTRYLCNGVNVNGSINCIFPACWSTDLLRCERSADWSEADLSGYSLTGAYLAGIDLSNSALVGTDLSWAEFRGADLTGSNMSDVNLGHAYVNGANFTNVVFDGADLSGVDFRNAAISGATGTGLEACPAHLPEGWSCFDLGDAGLTLLGPGSTLSGLNLTGANLSSLDLRGLQITDLIGCPAALPPNFYCINFPAIGYTLVGPRADLSGLDLTNANFNTVPNLNHVNFNSSTLTGATFTNDANLQSATFNNANVSNVTFGTDTKLDDANFIGANLTFTIFGTGTDLSDALLSSANLSNVNLAGTQLSGVSAVNLVTCPSALPTNWNCLYLSTTGNTLVGPEADLNGLNLTSANLSGMNLNRATFDGTNLTNAVLTGANLDNVDLDAATLTGIFASDLVHCPDELPNNWDCIRSTLVGPGANLAGLSFSGADLRDTHLQGAILTSANLNNADLSDANLTSANLTGATLNNADLNNADLAGATLTGVAAIDLEDCPDTLPSGWECVRRTLIGPGANLSGVGSVLAGTDLSNINLSGANLTGADLTGSDLSNANLSNANLTNVDLTDADLTDADMTNAVLTDVTWDNTICPDGSNSDSSGGTCIDNL